MGSLMHRAQDRAPVVRSKGRESIPRGQTTWVFHQRKIFQLPDKPHSLPTVYLLSGQEAVTEDGHVGMAFSSDRNCPGL